MAKTPWDYFEEKYLIFIWQNKPTTAQYSFIHPFLFQDKILKMAIWAAKKVTPFKPWILDLVVVVFLDKSWYVDNYWINLPPQLWLHWRHEKALFSCHLLLNNARNSLNLYDLLEGFVEAPGKYLWHFLRALWIPFKSYISVHMKLTFIPPWMFCQLTLHHTATGIKAKVYHRQIFVWFPICESFFNETWWKCFITAMTGNDGRSEETQGFPS